MGKFNYNYLLFNYINKQQSSTHYLNNTNRFNFSSKGPSSPLIPATYWNLFNYTCQNNIQLIPSYRSALTDFHSILLVNILKIRNLYHLTNFYKLYLIFHILTRLSHPPVTKRFSTLPRLGSSTLCNNMSDICSNVTYTRKLDILHWGTEDLANYSHQKVNQGALMVPN